MPKIGRDLFLASLMLGSAAAHVCKGASVSIELSDGAGLSEASLHQVMISMQHILSSGSLSFEIRPCLRTPTARCDPQTRPLEIRIVRDPPKFPGGRMPVLGNAVANLTGGTRATVFLEPIQEQALAAGVPWTVVLAYTAAHEIGHLLLGSGAHTPRGVMKAHWNRADYQSMNQWASHFTQEQSRRLALITGGTSTAPKR